MAAAAHAQQGIALRSRADYRRNPIRRRRADDRGRVSINDGVPDPPPAIEFGRTWHNDTATEIGGGQPFDHVTHH